MSKNTKIADLINYISVDSSGNVVLTTGGQVATQSYVTTAVANLVNSAPTTLDTLKELATALNNDANFATTVTNSIATKLPLSGGTLTGALYGTTATFSSSVTTANGIISNYGRMNGRFFITNESDYGDMTSTSGMVSIGYYPAGQEATIRSRNYSTSTNTKLTFDASQFTFSGGNLGIGTSSPSGGISGTEVALEISNSNVGVLALTSLAASGKKYQIYSSNDGGLYFRDGTSGSQRMSISSGGYIGIANTNPNFNLTVDAIAADAISWRNRGTEVGRLGIEGDTTNGWFALFNSGLTKVQLTAGPGNSWVAAGGGNFGVGTNSPQGKFHLDHGDTYNQGIQHNKTSTFVTETKFGRPSTTSSISIIYDIAGAEIAELRRNYSANTFRITNVSTTHLEINASGVVTKPLQPAFSMYCNSNVTGPAVVPLGGTIFNDGGYYNTSTYRFTAPVAGRYFFSFYDNVMANNSNPSYFGFRVNGGIRGAYAYTSTKTVGNWYLLGFQQIIKLNASDYVDVYNFGADRTDYGSAEWGNFSGYLLG